MKLSALILPVLFIFFALQPLPAQEHRGAYQRDLLWSQSPQTPLDGVTVADEVIKNGDGLYERAGNAAIKGLSTGLLYATIGGLLTLLFYILKAIKEKKITRESLSILLSRLKANIRIIYNGRSFRGLASGCLLWFLILVFTNNLTFEDILALDAIDGGRLGTLMFAPLFFYIVGLICWRWYRRGV